MLASDRIASSNDLLALSSSKFNIGGGGLDLNIKLPNTKSARKQQYIKNLRLTQGMSSQVPP